ncbi:MAG: hypothetical protein AAFR16_11235, partial [Pseudomonadota bacterium]
MFSIAAVFGGLTDQTTKTRSSIRSVSFVFSRLRAPAIVALLGFVAFALPGQTLEIYRLFAEEFDFASGFSLVNLRLALFFLMLYVCGYVIWYIARVLTMSDPRIRELLEQKAIAGRVARWAPRVFGALPAIGVGVGMARAEYFRDGDIRTDGLYGAAAIALLLGVLRIWTTWRRSRDGFSVFEHLRRTGFRMDVRLAFAAVLVAIMAYLMTQPTPFIQTVGTLTIFCFFMIALVFGLAQLTYLNDRYAIPALTILFGLVIGFSWFDLNDNHFARTLPPSEAAIARAEAAEAGPQLEDPRDAVTAAFRAWYASRADRAAYEEAGKPYPVYVVAAQGGGLYAAYQSATFLARLQDACPTFAQHVFVMSGVSGGSVGTTLFTALADRFAVNQPITSVSEPCGSVGLETGFEARVNALLAQDFLSPLVSGMLFGDFTARFSPKPIDEFDRARALEKSFELGWAATGAGEDDPGLERGLLSYWRPDGAAPALMLNTTEVQSGRRLVLSPIRGIAPEVRSYADEAVARDPALRAFGAPDLRLSTAMLLSARFPYITPAGSIQVRRIRELDGALGPSAPLSGDGAVELADPADLNRARGRDVGKARRQQHRGGEPQIRRA